MHLNGQNTHEMNMARSNNTEANKARRMAKHARKYPRKSRYTAEQRRAMSYVWKVEAARRAANAARNDTSQVRTDAP